MEAGDQLQPEALVQWADAARSNPEALLIAGDGEQMNHLGVVVRRHGALPASTRLRQLVQEQLYCPGALCLRRRLLQRSPLPLTPNLHGSYQDAWLVEVLEQHRDRIVVVPQRWVQTHQLSDWQADGRCRQRALELSAHLAQRWGESPAGLIHRYGLQLQLGEATVPQGSTALAELATALETARPLLGKQAWKQLQIGWGLNPSAAPWQERLEDSLRQGGLDRLWCVSLLRDLLHPELGALQLGSPWGPQLRLAERLLSPELWEQYRLLRQDEGLLQLLNQPIDQLPMVALLQWQRDPALQDRFPLPKALEKYRNWWGEHASSQLSHLPFNSHGEITAEPWQEQLFPSPEQRPFGVNLIGHAFEVFGIGEDVRMAALALESADVPYCVVNVPANNGAAASERSLEARTLPPGELGPYRFNLVCLAAPSHGAWIAREGLAQQRGRTTIVAWPWETQTWPKAWECMIPLADALWPSSTFTAKALEPFSDPLQKPLQVMPMAVHIEQPEQYREAARRRHTRERWGLDPEAKLVLFVFDVKSSLERKNPWGALEAFQQAFPKGNSDNVQLVIKALLPGSANQQWKRLQRQAAGDPRLRVIEADMKRGDLMALMGACDVFLSLHRSEGFGRGIAEAGVLGLQVVSSNWGGNVDFCQGESFHLVPCAATPILPGTYAQAEGHIWGEPDINMAAQLLLQAIGQSTRVTCPGSVLQNLSIKATGLRYREALNISDHIGQTPKA
ncbi:glycosyltransferase [Cyanobium sp. T1G-Tous]|uniref:glycosyltransferase n=1 Tax=Cyanobium sp. T1G-Tous TaxID=2823722 RepID=UPI0020CEBC2A|nr:glycosyltransferase [Cyanobium sp. T1G-Tous]MCP9802604.1 glycosyltransferase [Cyanobium sp. T1G-Tous]